MHLSSASIWITQASAYDLQIKSACHSPDDFKEREKMEEKGWLPVEYSSL